MNVEDRRALWDRAIECRATGAFIEAGDAFTVVCYDHLSASETVVSSFDENAPSIAKGLQSLLNATVCYRLGETGRSNNRSRQGELLCTDFRDHAISNPPQKGIMNEYIGDFRMLVEDRSGGKDSYTEALDYYESVEDRPFRHVQWQSEPEFELNNSFLFGLAKGAGYEFEGRSRPDLVGEPLPYRIEFKREHIPKIVDSLVENGNWQSTTNHP